jgi:hypothetical protein
LFLSDSGLCIFAILCAPPNTISNTIRDGLEDSIRLKNISRKVKDSINVSSQEIARLVRRSKQVPYMNKELKSAIYRKKDVV